MLQLVLPSPLRSATAPGVADLEALEASAIMPATPSSASENAPVPYRQPFANPGRNSAEPVAIASGAAPNSLGPLHTCVLLDNGGVKCWGSNKGGELGLGDQNERGVSSGQMGDNLPYVDLGH
jgi:hypothetical protein